MPFHTPQLYLQYFLKREMTQLFLSVWIRNFALGMILIFEPIYLYLYFDHSLTLTLLFFAAIQGGYGLLTPFGAKTMAKIGLKYSMLLSVPFLFGYYLCLYFLESASWLVGAAIILKFLCFLFYWPAFHTDFVRFSARGRRGSEVGKLHTVAAAAAITSPFIGGLILNTFGYFVLFSVVLIVLFISALPLFLSREVHEVYTDSYERAFGRLIRKKDWKQTVAFMALGAEVGIQFLIWPLFMFVLAIHYSSMGALTSGALILGLVFTLYIGRLTDRVNRARLLDIGALLRGAAWLLKCFVRNGFDAFLAQSFYRLSQKAAGIPHMAIVYDSAARQGAEADEFIVYREMTHNLGRALMFLILIFVFQFSAELYWAFPIAAVLSLLLSLYKG